MIIMSYLKAALDELKSGSTKQLLIELLLVSLGITLCLNLTAFLMWISGSFLLPSLMTFVVISIALILIVRD